MSDDRPILRRNAGDATTGVTCAICDTTFDSRGERLTHWATEHPGLLPASLVARVENGETQTTLTDDP